MCCGSPAVSIRLHLTFPDPVMPIALLILFALQFCVFSIGVVKSFLLFVMHADAPESQITLHAWVDLQDVDHMLADVEGSPLSNLLAWWSWQKDMLV